MNKNGFPVLFVVVLLLVITTSVAFAAANYSNWIPARNFPDIYYQTVNWSGGSDAEGVRWANQNPYRVKIFVKFTYRPTGTNVGDRVVNLEGGNTYSEIVQLGPNVGFNFTVDKD